MQPGFGFAQAAELAPYLSELGISHVYTSPYLQAAAGSTHGYDVVDPTRVNEELGGAEEHARFCGTLRSHGLGQMIDLVPNHLAVSGGRNPWWWDVLQNGRASRYARFFDIDWAAYRERWPDKVLLPILEDHYGRVLEEGRFRLSREDTAFVVHYRDHVLPIDPASLEGILSEAARSCASQQLADLAERFSRLPGISSAAEGQADRSRADRQEADRKEADRHRTEILESERHVIERHSYEQAVLLDLLARLVEEEAGVKAAIDREVERLNHDPDALDKLLEQQNYRLAFWRMAGRNLNYRRFFDITGLAGLRVEEEGVFQSIHALPIRWFREGLIQGLRVDHPDGLRDPTEYLQRLSEACPDAWIVAEKILGPSESLPSEWPIAGTTGYDFLSLLGDLLVDPQGEAELTRVYEDFTGDMTDFSTIVRECKGLVLDELLGSELNRLTDLFVQVCEHHRRHRDYTRHELREAFRETAACFPVYRSYASADRHAVTPDDERHVIEAVQQAMQVRADLDPELFRFLREILLLRIPGTLAGELVMRFQQLTGPAMAKGLEDTAFYRYLRLVSLNEVGGDPSHFGVAVDRFHEWCAEAQAERPLALLASQTHDTKRSGDVRARLAVLSEISTEWGSAVDDWAEHNRRHRRADVPDAKAEYLLYQTLVGAWPIKVPRVTAYMEKAVREAKVHTSWIRVDDLYERRLKDFVVSVMEDPVFRASVEAFVAPLVMPGRLNSLAQTLLKLTAPGVPDVYQGTELWDLSLVDPDNRRPIDFSLRRRMLDEANSLSPEDILARMDTGLPKLWLIQRVLQFRRDNPEPFYPEASYRPIFARGPRSENVVAFVRGGRVVALVPRFNVKMGGDWGGTALELPEGLWENIFTGEKIVGGLAGLQDLTVRFPVALLARR